MLTPRNRALCLVIGMIALFVAAGCASRRQYSAEELEWLNTEETLGIVTKQGKGRFFLQNRRSGETHMFQTAASTQYVPEGYRSQVGDTVRVVYTKKVRTFYRKEGSPFVKRVYQLHSVVVAPENEMPQMPMRGEVVEVGPGSRSLRSSASFTLRLHDSKRTFKIHVPFQVTDNIPGGVKGLLRRDVEVYVKRIPNRKLNWYHYVAEKLRLYSGKAITKNM